MIKPGDIIKIDATRHDLNKGVLFVLGVYEGGTFRMAPHTDNLEVLVLSQKGTFRIWNDWIHPTDVL